jgi:hypothetical protein
MRAGIILSEKQLSISWLLLGVEFYQAETAKRSLYFPVYQGNSPETGSHWTATTANKIYKNNIYQFFN